MGDGHGGVWQSGQGGGSQEREASNSRVRIGSSNGKTQWQEGTVTRGQFLPSAL